MSTETEKTIICDICEDPMLESDAFELFNRKHSLICEDCYNMYYRDPFDDV